MPTPTFSINAAAEILEKDRRTLVKSLRHVKPDATVRGAHRWRLRTIIDALERMRPAPAAATSGLTDPRLTAIHHRFDAAEEKLNALPTVATRRVFAISTLRPLIDEMLLAHKEHGRSMGRDPEFTALLGDKLYLLALRAWERPCQWTQAQCWAAMYDDDEDV